VIEDELVVVRVAVEEGHLEGLRVLLQGARQKAANHRAFSNESVATGLTIYPSMPYAQKGDRRDCKSVWI